MRVHIPDTFGDYDTFARGWANARHGSRLDLPVAQAKDPYELGMVLFTALVPEDNHLCTCPEPILNGWGKGRFERVGGIDTCQDCGAVDENCRFARGSVVEIPGPDGDWRRISFDSDPWADAYGFVEVEES